jgi:hypothetical protein
MQMPVLSIFLAARGERLEDMAVEQIRQAGSTRSLARALASTGQKIGAMGEGEMAEGLVRITVSEGMAERSAELAVAGEILAERGVEEVAAAAEAGQLAREIAAEGAADMAAGSAELGAAAATEGFAEALEEKSK